MSASINDSEIDRETAKLEALREQFVTQTTIWLRQWYRECAYGYAAGNVANSLQLGGEGLRQFRLEVDAVIAQAEQIVACFLNDEVWWHADPYMSRDTVVYSVRLCMGRLRDPLHRFGYIRNYEWREAAKISVRRPNQRGDAIEWGDEIEFHPVAANRPFFRSDAKDKALPSTEWSTEGWSSLMLATLREYFDAADRVKEMTRVAERQREVEAAQESARAVKEALAYAALKGNDDDEFTVPKTSLSDVLRNQRRST